MPDLLGTSSQSFSSSPTRYLESEQTGQDEGLFPQDIPPLQMLAKSLRSSAYMDSCPGWLQNQKLQKFLSGPMIG